MVGSRYTSGEQGPQAAVMGERKPGTPAQMGSDCSWFEASVRQLDALLDQPTPYIDTC